MRLNPFNTGNINVRSSGGGGGGFPGGGGGKLGCGTLVIAAIGALVFGIDPMQTIGVVESVQQTTGGSGRASSTDEQEICTRGPYANEACNALQSLNQTWAPEFQRVNIPFEQPFLDLYTGGGVRSGCGNAPSSAGPFYCPADKGIYINTEFYDQMDRQMGAGGDFARLYVLAHEYGHHIQNLTGLAGQVRSVQQQNPRRSNELQVRMELQADCYAGVWAGKNRNLIEPGDMQEGMTAASAIGDDTLQRNAGQRVNPESFTHGTSQQRMQALRSGLDSADDGVCDAYFQNL